MGIRVLIVDDSAMVRRVLSEELGKDPMIQVVGAAKDPLDASEKIEQLNPDVLTLDLEMPQMDGMTFLRRLMRHHPMPVVVVSAYTKKGSKLALEALENGALDIVPKPGMAYSLSEMTGELVGKIKVAAKANVGQRTPQGSGASRSDPLRAPRSTVPGVTGRTFPGASFSRKASEPVNVLPRLDRELPQNRMIAIGSSTGGTQALQYIVSRLPDDMPPILIVQHMPAGFTKAFADRLNGMSPMEVKEAEDHDQVRRGRVLIAPGGKHMVLRKGGSKVWVELNEGPKVCRQRPAVEVLFQSAANSVGGSALGVILTGMGNDGAEGMLAMKKAGSITIAEDEKSCVVFGMPMEAIKKGGVDHVVHLHQIALKLTQLV